MHLPSDSGCMWRPQASLTGVADLACAYIHDCGCTLTLVATEATVSTQVDQAACSSSYVLA